MSVLQIKFVNQQLVYGRWKGKVSLKFIWKFLVFRRLHILFLSISFVIVAVFIFFRVLKNWGPFLQKMLKYFRALFLSSFALLLVMFRNTFFMTGLFSFIFHSVLEISPIFYAFLSNFFLEFFTFSVSGNQSSVYICYWVIFFFIIVK